MASQSYQDPPSSKVFVPCVAVIAEHARLLLVDRATQELSAFPVIQRIMEHSKDDIILLIEEQLHPVEDIFDRKSLPERVLNAGRQYANDNKLTAQTTVELEEAINAVTSSLRDLWTQLTNIFYEVGRQDLSEQEHLAEDDLRTIRQNIVSGMEKLVLPNANEVMAKMFEDVMDFVTSPTMQEQTVVDDIMQGHTQTRKRQIQDMSTAQQPRPKRFSKKAIKISPQHQGKVVKKDVDQLKAKCRSSKWTEAAINHLDQVLETCSNDKPQHQFWVQDKRELVQHFQSMSKYIKANMEWGTTYMATETGASDPKASCGGSQREAAARKKPCVKTVMQQTKSAQSAASGTDKYTEASEKGAEPSQGFADHKVGQSQSWGSSGLPPTANTSSVATGSGSGSGSEENRRSQGIFKELELSEPQPSNDMVNDSDSSADGDVDATQQIALGAIVKGNPGAAQVTPLRFPFQLIAGAAVAAAASPPAQKQPETQAGGTPSPVPAVRQGDQPDAAVEAVRAANHRTAADHSARANAVAADEQGKTSPTFIEAIALHAKLQQRLEETYTLQQNAEQIAQAKREASDAAQRAAQQKLEEFEAAQGQAKQQAAAFQAVQRQLHQLEQAKVTSAA